MNIQQLFCNIHKNVRVSRNLLTFCPQEWYNGNKRLAVFNCYGYGDGTGVNRDKITGKENRGICLK